jgi:hypothetical protein
LKHAIGAVRRALALLENAMRSAFGQTHRLVSLNSLALYQQRDASRGERIQNEVREIACGKSRYESAEQMPQKSHEAVKEASQVAGGDRPGFIV